MPGPKEDLLIGTGSVHLVEGVVHSFIPDTQVTVAEGSVPVVAIGFSVVIDFRPGGRERDILARIEDIPPMLP